MAQNPMKNQASHRADSRAGSILVMIFIFAALFGALSFAMLQGSRSGKSSLTTEQARLKAVEIIEYATGVQNAVKSMLIDGCTDTNLSFATPANASYYLNSAAPADFRCHVFYPQGGAIKYAPAPDGAQNVKLFTGNPQRDTNQYFYAGTMQFFALNAPDLSLWLLHVDKNVCAQVNTILGIDSETATITSIAVDSSRPYKGASSYQNLGLIGDTGSLMRKKMGCIESTNGVNSDSSPGVYNFYAILIERF